VVDFGRRLSSDVTVTGAYSNEGDTSVQSGATLTVQTFVSDSGPMTVDGTLIVHDNLRAKGGPEIIANGLVVLDSNGAGDFAVAGTLEIGGSYAGSDTIEMDGGDLWLAGRLGDATFTLDTATVDHLFFDSLKSTTGNSFSGGAVGDTIGIEGVTINSTNYVGTTLTLNTSGGAFTFTNVNLAPGLTPGATGTTTFRGNSYGFVELACFAAGTCIDTPDGPIVIEALRAGAHVLTARGEVRPVRWIGHRHVDLDRHPDPEMARPIRVAAGAFASGVPRRDVRVSPDHALLVGGVLVPARLLTNGATICRDDACRSVTYYHVELDSHDILLADGLPAESYLDTGNRGFFSNGGAPLVLHPDLMEEGDHPTREAGSCGPFVSDEAGARTAWQCLADRAATLGRPVTPPEVTRDARLRVIANGRVLRPMHEDGDRFSFALPNTATEIRLVSRSTPPTVAKPWTDDRRRLGVCVTRITVRAGREVADVPLDGRRYSEAGGSWSGTATRCCGSP
jgi:Hint domain